MWCAEYGNYCTEFFCHHFFAKISWNQLFTNEFYSKLIWRKKISMAANFSFFHTVLWKFRNFTATVSSQKFREIDFLLKYFTLCKLIWRKKFCMAANFSFFHTVKGNFRSNIFTEKLTNSTSLAKDYWTMITLFKRSYFLDNSMINSLKSLRCTIAVLTFRK